MADYVYLTKQFRSLLDSAVAKHGDLPFVWRLGPFAAEDIAGEGNHIYKLCGIRAVFRLENEPHRADLYCTEVRVPFSVTGPCSSTTKYVRCGSINTKTGEIDYGESNG